MNFAKQLFSYARNVNVTLFTFNASITLAPAPPIQQLSSTDSSPDFILNYNCNGHTRRLSFSAFDDNAFAELSININKNGKI